MKDLAIHDSNEPFLGVADMLVMTKGSKHVIQYDLRCESKGLDSISVSFRG